MKHTLGSNIRRLRKRLELSLDDVSRLTGLSSGYLGRLERDEPTFNNPTYLTLISISKALSVNLKDLIIEPKSGLSLRALDTKGSAAN